MKWLQRGILALFLFALTPMGVLAQDDSITVTGSGIAHPLFSALADNVEDFEYDLNTTGTEDGFEQFCNGEAQVVNTNAAISLEQENLCNQNSIEFVELRLGYEGIAFVAHPDLTFANCVSTLELDSLLAPSAAQNQTWDAVISADENATPINVFLPPADTITSVLLDEQVSGFGFRADAETQQTSAEMIEAVAETTGGFGVINLSALVDAEEADVILVELRNNDIAQCIAPSGETIADESYIGGTPLYSYINSEALTGSLSAFAEFVAEPDSAEVVTDAGFAAPTDDDYEILQEVVANNETGRQFSRSLTAFQIPPTVSGTVNVGGAAGAYSLLDTVASSFTQQYQNATINVNTEGEPVGLRRLCNSEIDVAATYGPVPEETRNNCEASDIDLLEIDLGTQAVVLVANEADEYLSCVTPEQVVSAWGATSSDPVETWQTVSEDFPDQDMTLFAGGTLGDPLPNLMLLDAAGRNIPLREDIETDSDPLYRAAAVANVEGAMTYMSWQAYQEVLANEQERIQLVAVDAGDGCITPSEETIESGEYPFTRDIQFAISRRALERQPVQSYLWFLFSDERFDQFGRLELVELSLRDLADIRETLQTAYEEANLAAQERAAAEAAATATEEATDAE